MLVLSRKKQERVLVGGRITVTVLRISKNQVQIGIDAPPDTKIRRSELLEAGVVGPKSSQDTAA